MARKKTKDVVAEGYMETFEWAYRKSSKNFERMEELQNIYDNVIDSASMPTVSEIPIPMIFTMVEKSLPTAMSYLFPKDDRFIRLNPLQFGTSIESITRVEDALQDTVMNRVRLHDAGIETIKDCMKLGIGYGIVDTVVVTPPIAFIKQLNIGGTVQSTRVIEAGTPVRAIRYKYVNPGRIVVTPDGTDFNGDRAPSISFYVDYYSDRQFRNLYAEQPVDGENKELLGNVEEIIDEARNEGFNPRIPITDIIAKLAGYKIHLDSPEKDKPYPVIIPVVKCYEPNRHIWIANGTRVIFDQSSKLQTMRCPLVKACAWPEGERWYPMTPVEAAYKMSLGVNIWFNAVFDLLTNVLKPVMAYDKTKFPNGAPERGPNGTIGLSGPIRDGVDYIRPPDMPNQLFTVGELLQRVYGEAVGQSSFLDNAQPGLLRGGAFAFESLLQTTSGRERLVGAILETRWLESSIQQILLNMQLNAGDDPVIFERRQYKRETGEEYISQYTVTPDDLINAFEVELSLAEKYKNTAANFANRQADMQAGMGSPYTDKWEVMREFYGSDARAKRLLKSKEEVARMEEEEIRANNMQRAIGIQEGIGAIEQQQSNQGEQALAGAGAAALGGGQ